jgi:ribosome recycling factor
VEELIKLTENKMQKAFDFLSEEYKIMRAGKANPSILNKIKVNYYGEASPIEQVASISVSDARVLVIQPWDSSIISEIEKAIQKSDLGIAPQSDGKVIRLNFPPLSEDRRKELSKEISVFAENAKISVRNARRDALEKIKKTKKDGKLNENEVNREEKKIQNITDSYIIKIDSLKEGKTNQVMQI